MLEGIQIHFPNQFHMSEKEGNLLIHLVCGAIPVKTDKAARDMAPQIINFVLDEYPESVSLSDGYGRLPLHVAAQNHVIMGILELLMSLEMCCPFS
jgi:hypothetical protein